MPAAVEALLAAEIVGHRQQPRFDLALPFVLRVGIEFVARDDLRRDRRLVCAQFGRHQCGKFGFRQLVAHDLPPLWTVPGQDRPCNRRLSADTRRDRAMVFLRCSARLFSNQRARC